MDVKFIVGNIVYLCLANLCSSDMSKSANNFDIFLIRAILIILILYAQFLTLKDVLLVLIHFYIKVFF